MQYRYQGLPAAASVEQAIIKAQVLMLRDLEQKPKVISEPTRS